MEIINSPISQELIWSFKQRKQWDSDKLKDVIKTISREDNPKVLTSLIETYEELEGNLVVWGTIYHRLNLKTMLYEASTEYARLEVYSHTSNFVLSSNDGQSYYYTQGANYALLESYSLLRLVP